ncbi:MAG: hypothetical protein GKR95_22360 [Gammaproteobacteria bacterium]|nr:hypothetical protein [Gammaproteobacteria bacterium]
MAIDDINGNMKSEPQYKLEHRLTGAIVLVFAAVLVIPMLLEEPEFGTHFTQVGVESTGEKQSTIKVFKSKIAPVNAANLEKEPNEDTLVSVVVPKKSLKTVSIGGTTIAENQSSSSSASVSSTSQASSQGQAKTKSDGESRPALKIAGAVASQGVDKKPSTTSVEGTNGKTAGKKVVLVKKEETSSTKTRTPQQSVARATQSSSQPSKKDNSAPVDKSVGQWIVRVGTFSKPGNVESVTRLLNSKGLPAKTTKVQTSFGDATRIWLGPYSDRKAAQTISVRLKKLTGENGYITKHQS